MTSQLKIPKSPFKSRYEAIGWVFGAPLEDFNSLLPVKPPADAEKPGPSNKSPDTFSSLSEVAMDMDNILPSNLDVINHWIFVCDRTRTSKSFPEANEVIWKVTDNLREFWKKQTSIELR